MKIYVLFHICYQSGSTSAICSTDAFIRGLFFVCFFLQCTFYFTATEINHWNRDQTIGSNQSLTSSGEWAKGWVECCLRICASAGCCSKDLSYCPSKRSRTRTNLAQFCPSNLTLGQYQNLT